MARTWRTMTAVVLMGWAAACSSDAPAAKTTSGSDAAADATGAGDTAASDTSAADAEPPPPPPRWPEPFAFAPQGLAECPTAAPPPASDPLAQLLAALGTDRSVGIQRTLLEKFGGTIGKDKDRLPFFHDLQEDMDGLGACWSANLARAADWAVQSDHPRANLLAVLGWSLERQVAVGGAFAEIDTQRPLVAALEQLHGIYGEPFDATAAEAEAAAVPLAVQEATARLLVAAMEAATLRNQWLEAIGQPGRHKHWYDKGAGLLLVTPKGAVDPDNPKDAPLFSMGPGYDLLLQGALRLMQASDEAALTGAKTAQPFGASFTTPLGRVVLRGGGDDVWDPADPKLSGDLLLALDTGGNDTWLVRAGANTSADNPVAVAIDLGGDDLYDYPKPAQYDAWQGLMPPDEDSRTVASPGYAPLTLSERSRQGSGRLGIGMLLDLGQGKDTYRALRKSQGYANFGVGVLWDEGGDDTYDGEAAVQGSANVGFALAYDGGGRDRRTAFYMSQGYAWTASGALLYDRDGDDDYVCVVDQPLVYPSPQTQGIANASLCQGVAFGARRDNTGTHRSGGLGILRDRTGNDSYRGATFVQGVGYWFGIGVLADGAGDDDYDGLFYAQAAAAHFALAFLLESGGHDLYNLLLKPMNAVLGIGHDFSSALMVEGGGNDTYRGSSRSLGAAKCHGHGLFVERDGEDVYDAIDDKAIGWATDYDWAPGSCGSYTTVPSWGFFVDQGGKDTYTKPAKQLPKQGEVGNGQLWVTDDPDEPKAKEVSGGIDGEGLDCGIVAE